MVASFSSRDFAALIEELASSRQSHENADLAKLRLQLFQAWAELDPHASSAALEGLGLAAPSGSHRAIASTWGRSNPGEAALWARGLADDSHRQEALIGLGGEMAFKDPRLAIKLATEAGMTSACQDFLLHAASTWTTQDPDAAVAWAKGISDETLRAEVIAGVAISWADKEPYKAADLIIDSMNGGTIEENAVVGVVQRIAFRDVASAREWVARFPEGRMRERAAVEVARIAERLGSASNEPAH